MCAGSGGGVRGVGVAVGGGVVVLVCVGARGGGGDDIEGGVGEVGSGSSNMRGVRFRRNLDVCTVSAQQKVMDFVSPPVLMVRR